MHSRELRHQKSTDVAGLFRYPEWAYGLYCMAGFRHFSMEMVSFPFAVIDLMAKDKRKTELKYPVAGIHSRTNEWIGKTIKDNGFSDILKILVADPLLLDITYESDVKVLGALDRLRVAGERKYLLVHASELMDPVDRRRYAEVFNRKEHEYIDLYIECDALPYGHLALQQTVKQMQDLGVKNVKPVADTVHFFKAQGLDFRDMPTLVNEWPKLLKWIERVDPVLLHWSEGLPDDAHDMEVMRVEGKTMMRDLGCLLREQGIVFMTENQQGVFGPVFKDQVAEQIETQKHNGAFYREVGLIKETEFVG